MEENIIISPQTFISRGRAFSLNASSNLSFVKINGKDVSNYLAPGTSIGWYDVSKNSGREVTNANGTMILNVIATKYRLDLTIPYLENNKFIDFFSEIVKAPTMTVEFLNPFTGEWKTIHAYRGDRNASPYMPVNNGLLYQGTTVSLIEL